MIDYLAIYFLVLGAIFLTTAAALVGFELWEKYQASRNGTLPTKARSRK